MNDLHLVLTSAAVASLVTGTLALYGQHWEREARRRELLLKTALDAGKNRADRVLEIARMTGIGVDLPHDLMLTGSYYGWIEHLYKTGKLPQEAINAEQALLMELEKAREENGRLVRENAENYVRMGTAHPSIARQVLSQAQQLKLTKDQIELLLSVATQL